MFSRQTFDTLDDPTSSPPPGDGGEEEEIQPEMEEEDYRQQEEEPEVVRMGGKLLNFSLFKNSNVSIWLIFHIKIDAQKNTKDREKLVKWQQLEREKDFLFQCRGAQRSFSKFFFVLANLKYIKNRSQGWF